MRQCLDEGMLQSYFDGELSTEMMESATSHLASCAACAAAASELEQESLLFSTALAAEFESSVPTERLRQRIDAAVAGLQVANTGEKKSGVVAALFNSISALFTLGPGRALGYASLMVLLAFGLILGLMKLRTPAPVQDSGSNIASRPAVSPVKSIDQPEPTTSGKPEIVEQTSRNVATNKNAKPGRSIVAKPPAVKLIPGERSYLQTIAKLDSTIRSGGNKSMRPALQVEYEKNLAVVDRAIAATRRAAKSNPNDPDAADFMFAAYESKVNLLNTIADARVYNRSH
jgi:Putative zinc-finger